MQFLWSLLPGAREARNQVIVGYAWIAALALLIGVPTVSPSGDLGKLTGAIGPVGIGVALSFAAFLLGSFLDELVSPIFRIRGGMAFTTGEVDPVLLLREMSERENAELEKLEGNIDRLNGEITLRAGLSVPILIAGWSQLSDSWKWPALASIVVLALAVQLVLRRRRIGPDLKSSDRIRDAIRARLPGA